MILAAFILVAGFFAAYILLPFFEKSYKNKSLSYGETDKENLTYRKEQVLDAIQDLEYDHKMHKITDQDYNQLKEKLTQQAVEIMKRLDALENGSHLDAIGQQTRTRA
jgi:hypothetical protein